MHPPASHPLGTRLAAVLAFPLLLGPAAVRPDPGQSVVEEVPTSFLVQGATDGSARSSIATPGRLPRADASPTILVADRLEFFVQPSPTTAGQAITPAIVVRALNPDDSVDTTFTGTITLSRATGPSSVTISGDTEIAVAGVATFDDVSLDLVGNYRLRATSGPLQSEPSDQFRIDPGPADSLAFGTPPSDVEVDEAIAPAVTVEAFDAFGNLATDFGGEVALAIGANPGGGNLGGDPTRDASSGVATFSDLTIDAPGAGYTLVASSAGLVGDESAPFDVTSSAATELRFGQGPTNTVAGQAIAPPITVEATHSDGDVDSSFTGPVTIAIATNPGGGALSGTATQPAVDGVATFPDLSIDRTGVGYRLQATSAPLTAVTSAAFDITPGPASGAATTITASPTSITADGVSTSTISVDVRDALGNLRTGGGDTVALSTTLGSLSPNPLLHVGNGRYQATLTSGTTPGTATVTGTVNTNPIADDATVDFLAGGAGRLLFEEEPSDITAGTAFAPTVSVRAVDANDNTDTTFTGPITLAIEDDPSSGATLLGVATRNAAAGVATFPGLSIDLAGEGYTLGAAAAGLGGAVSQAFDVGPGAASPTTSTIEAEPDFVAADGASASTITVVLRDPFGNQLDAGGDAVQLVTDFGLLSPIADLGDGRYTSSITSTAAGTATITGLVNGVSIGDDATVVFVAGSATRLVIVDPPTDSPAGSTITPPIRVAAVDGSGNPVTDFNGPVTAAIAAGSPTGTLSGTTTAAATGGTATFTDLSISPAGAGYRLRFTSPGLDGVTSDPFTITAGSASPATSTIDAQPATIPANGTSTSTIAVQLRDANGQPLSIGGDRVALATTAGTLGSVSDLGNGRYTATLTSSITPATATITGTVNGGTIADTASVTFAAGATDLAISATVDNPTPRVGDRVVTTITVTNGGPQRATGVQVENPLPARLRFERADPSRGTYVAATGVWSVGTLEIGEDATLVLTATVTAP